MSPNNLRFRHSKKDALKLRSDDLGKRRLSSIFKNAIELRVGSPVACSFAQWLYLRTV